MKPEEKIFFSSGSDCTARRLTSSRTGRSRNSIEFPRPPAQSTLPPLDLSLDDLNDHENAWPLEANAMEWVLREAEARGIPVTGVEVEETGGWWQCHPASLLSQLRQPGCTAWVTQQPGCGGYVTTVSFSHTLGRWGAWLADRLPGEPESPKWRSLILETLVLGGLQY